MCRGHVVADEPGYAQHFQAVDAAHPWRPVLQDEHGLRLNPRFTAPGAQTAIVVGPDGETTSGATGPLYTDQLGRLKVRFHWMEQGASCCCTACSATPGKATALSDALRW